MGLHQYANWGDGNPAEVTFSSAKGDGSGPKSGTGTFDLHFDVVDIRCLLTFKSDYSADGAFTTNPGKDYAEDFGTIHISTDGTATHTDVDGVIHNL